MRVRQRRCCCVSERMLDAPQLVDNYYLNLLDCGCRNVLSIELGNTVYLWDASDCSTTELVTADEDNGPVTGVSWALDGLRIAIRLNSSEFQLWNSSSSSSRLITGNSPLSTSCGCTLSRSGHDSSVCAVEDWEHIDYYWSLLL